MLEPILAELELALWDVRYEKDGASWFLRVFIDREDGVRIEDCENVSRRLSELLDDDDPIDGSYYLEVSSPGIERAFTQEWQLRQYTGSIVNVRMIRPVDGQRDFRGELVSAENGTVTILQESGEEITFAQQDAAFVRLHYDYDKDMRGREDQ